MSDQFIAMVFAALVLAPLTGGLLRVVWVVLFDEYIGFIKLPPPRPPAGFEVGLTKTNMAEGDAR